METIRVIYISGGVKYLAPIIAFFEIVIWLLAMEVIMSDFANIANFLVFAFGFAMGTYVGLVIEEKLSIGIIIMHIVTSEQSKDEIVSFLDSEQYGVTSLDGKCSRGKVNIILSLVNRVGVSRITEHLQEINRMHSFPLRTFGM